MIQLFCQPISRHLLQSPFLRVRFDSGACIWFPINSFTKGGCVASKYGRSTPQWPRPCFPHGLSPVPCLFCPSLVCLFNLRQHNLVILKGITAASTSF